jgi:N-acetylneuraminate lyase
MKITDLVPAALTPFTPQGDVDLNAIEKLANHFVAVGCKTVFVCGTTGEWSSLTVPERMSICERWCQVGKTLGMKIIAHVGSNSYHDSAVLAAHAQKAGAVAISALAPSYFKPKNAQALAAFCAEIAKAAPALPFYYYDMPGLTGVTITSADFLDAAADLIPNLNGIKFTNPDLLNYQKAKQAYSGRFDLIWGTDEFLLSAIVVGCNGAVGSSYNIGAPIYHRLRKAFQAGDHKTAQAEQFRSVQFIDLMQKYGYIPALKAALNMIGINVGPARLPLSALTKEQSIALQSGLETMDFFDWIRP